MLLLTTDKKYYLLEKKMLSDHNNFIHNINIYFHLSIAKNARYGEMWRVTKIRSILLECHFSLVV